MGKMTIPFNDEAEERLKDVGEKVGKSYARILTCLLAQPDATIKAIVEEHHDTLFPAARDRKAKDKEILDLVKGIPAARLAAILAAAEKE